jgi:hypothetical protein
MSAAALQETQSVLVNGFPRIWALKFAMSISRRSATRVRSQRFVRRCLNSGSRSARAPALVRSLR